MNPDDTETTSAKVHCKKPQNPERLTAAPDNAPLRLALAANIVGMPVGSGWESANLSRDDALDLVQVLIDGPLSDLSILVQIPAVRELAEAFVEADDFIREEYEYLIDRDPNDQAMTESWRAALEATDG